MLPILLLLLLLLLLNIIIIIIIIISSSSSSISTEMMDCLTHEKHTVNMNLILLYTDPS